MIETKKGVLRAAVERRGEQRTRIVVLARVKQNESSERRLTTVRLDLRMHVRHGGVIANAISIRLAIVAIDSRGADAETVRGTQGSVRDSVRPASRAPRQLRRCKLAECVERTAHRGVAVHVRCGAAHELDAAE